MCPACSGQEIVELCLQLVRVDLAQQGQALELEKVLLVRVIVMTVSTVVTASAIAQVENTEALNDLKGREL